MRGLARSWSARRRTGAHVRGLDRRRMRKRRDRGHARRGFNRSVLGHLVGLGPPAPREVVRAVLLRLANAVASGHQVRGRRSPRRWSRRSTRVPPPVVRSLGTVGQADLAENADLAHGALGELELEAGEAIALLVSNAFSTGQAALAVADARRSSRDRRRRGTRLRGARGERRGVAPRRRRRAPVSRDRRDADPDARAASRAAACGSPMPRASSRIRSRSARPQVHGAARDSLRFVEESSRSS